MPIDPLKKGEKTLEKIEGKINLKKKRKKGTFLRILLRKNSFDDKPLY